MPDVRIHKASEMKPQTRAALEAELGRALKDSEEVSIMAFETDSAATGGARSQAARGLKENLKRIDEKTKDVPDSEMEEALDEALRSARPRYRERE